MKIDEFSDPSKSRPDKMTPRVGSIGSKKGPPFGFFEVFSYVFIRRCRFTTKFVSFWCVLIPPSEVIFSYFWTRVGAAGTRGPN